jgi:predicted metal-dependent peptidase
MAQKRTEVTAETIKHEDVSHEIKTQSLATALYQTTLEKKFLGAVMQCMNISYTHLVPTAGVSYNKDLKRFDMYINPHFFCKILNDQQRIAVLLHEIYHIIHQHPSRIGFKHLPQERLRLLNVAADMVINQFIKNLPEGCYECKDQPADSYQCKNPDCCGKCINIKDFYDEVGPNKTKRQWEENKSAEYYYEKLLQRYDDPEDFQQNDDGTNTTKSQNTLDTFDVHDWDGSGDEKEVLSATEDLFKRAIVKSGLSQSSLPGFVQDMFDSISTRKAELDYKRLILSAIKRSASGHERKSTWTRLSRRFGIYSPGTKEGDLPKLHIYADTSGSISAEELNCMLSVIDEFLRVGSRKCRLNMFHTENYYSEEYKLGQRVSKEMFQSGGTDLTESFKDIWKRKPDLAIVITDGCYDDVNVESWMRPGQKWPHTLFIVTEEGREDHPLIRLGKTIKMPIGSLKG